MRAFRVEIDHLWENIQFTFPLLNDGFIYLTINNLQNVCIVNSIALRFNETLTSQTRNCRLANSTATSQGKNSRTRREKNLAAPVLTRRPRRKLHDVSRKRDVNYQLRFNSINVAARGRTDHSRDTPIRNFGWERTLRRILTNIRNCRATNRFIGMNLKEMLVDWHRKKYGFYRGHSYEYERRPAILFYLNEDASNFAFTTSNISKNRMLQKKGAKQKLRLFQRGKKMVISIETREREKERDWMILILAYWWVNECKMQRNWVLLWLFLTINFT